MNWLRLIVLGILGWNTYRGYKKGLLRMLYAFVAWILIFLFVSVTTPSIANFLTEHTQISEKVKAGCQEQLQKIVEDKLQQSEQNIEEALLSELSLELPESWVIKMQEQGKNTAELYMDENGIYERIAKEITQYVIKGIAGVIAFILAIVLSCLIDHALGKISRIPVLRGINQKIGIAAGFLYGLIIVWLGMYLIALCSSSEIGKLLNAGIHESRLLLFLYQNNPVITLIMSL